VTDLGQGRAMLDPTPSPEARRSTPEGSTRSRTGTVERARITEGRGTVPGRGVVRSPSPCFPSRPRPAPRHPLPGSSRAVQLGRLAGLPVVAHQHRSSTVGGRPIRAEGLGRLVPEGQSISAGRSVPGHPPRPAPAAYRRSPGSPIARSSRSRPRIEPMAIGRARTFPARRD